MVLADFWWLFGLFSAWVMSAQILFAQKYQMDGTRLAHMRCLAVCILLTPVMLIAPIPQDPDFYIGSIGVGFLASIADVLVFTSSARYGATATSRFLPMMVFGSFFLWFFVKPEQIQLYFDAPYIALGVLVCLTVAVFSISSMRKGSVKSASAFKLLLPVVVLYAFCDVFNKIAMDAVPLGYGNYQFMYVICLIIALNTGLFMKFKGESVYLVDKDNFRFFWKSGFVMAIIYILAMTGRTTGISLTSNPAFLSVIGLSSPVWILFYHWYKKNEDEYDNVKATFIFLAAVSSLVILTSYLGK